ncbi:HAD-IA family hydrolase [Paractinoplanes brasiliensis]|uniref:Sugar-phosphatase n=1 Tax=Paractinoplanes brasiliensis TaxID=52695 RepID=A0A4R6JRH7_9ACTN|nr:HAD-IA family hydrolase [Actinoplanes brasiliensis]TDO39029.1 sugar-phosphatase [Actinoplanes brasiliensis]GID30271.1 phosphatase [Actinoplanes brasiliensis]
MPDTGPEPFDITTVRAILFDMDGTLVDSDGAVLRSWLSWAAEYGVDGQEAYEMAHGSPSATTVRKLLPHLDEAALVVASARQLELQYDDLSDVRPTPGARELLLQLTRKGLPWAVVTSADSRLAKARLNAAGIVAPVLVTTDDIAAGKPDPEGYRRAAELLQVDPKDCLVVEDAEVGLQAGRAAGARTAALRGLDGDLRLRTLADLATLLG